MSAASGRQVAVLAVMLLGLSALPATAAGPTVVVRDNEFVRLGQARPAVRVRAGTVVAWRWASRQSHNVTVRSGPQRFRSPTQSEGTFRRRLVRRGTYRLACSLHAPGMRMTLVVR
jgi:plastocyanin